MKKTLVLAFALAASLSLVACKDKKEEGGGGGDDKAQTAKVDVSPEMQAFLADLKGKHTDVEAAINKHGVGGLDHKDMTMYDLKSPKVTATRKDGDKTCYTFDAKSGVTTRTYEVCWTGGKISEVADKGMR